MVGRQKQRIPACSTQSSLLVMPLVIAAAGSLSVLTLELSTSLQWSVTSHLKAVVRAVYCTLGAIIFFFFFMRMHPAFCIFKSRE